MKTRKHFFVLLAMLCLALPMWASGLGNVRVNARFLTDKMAFELHLNQRQYDDLYEINYDFFYNIDNYVFAMARNDARAMDMYYHYLDMRNDELRWILSDVLYGKFMAIEYFFRPVYALNNACYLRIYKVYPNRTFFHFGRPHHYLTYRGEHCRHHFKGDSYYKRRAPKDFHRTMYKGDFRSREDFRRHDFMPPRPGGVGAVGHHDRPNPPVAPRPNVRPNDRPGRRPEVRPDKRNDRNDRKPDNRPKAGQNSGAFQPDNWKPNRDYIPQNRRPERREEQKAPRREGLLKKVERKSGLDQKLERKAPSRQQTERKGRNERRGEDSSRRYL